MRNFIKKNLVLILAIISLLYGTKIGFDYYFYSSGLYTYITLSTLLVVLFFWLKPYQYFIKKNQAIALIPICIIYSISWLVVDHFLRFGIFLFATLCFLYLGLLIYNSKSKLGKLLFIGAYLISSFNIVSVLFLIAEKTRITRTLIKTLFISNQSESSEYLKSKFSIWHLLVLAVFILASLALFFGKKEVKEPSFKMNWKFLLLFAFAFGLSSFSGPLGALSSEYYIFLQTKKMLKELSEQREKRLNEMTIDYNMPQNAAKKIMVIIGESLNKNKMGLYGFSKNTTPNLLALSKDTSAGKLFHFNNVISPEVMTIPALTKILTNINYENKIPFLNAVSILDLFKKANYETSWISNQIQLGQYDTPVVVISSSADHVYYTSDKNDIKNKNAATGNYFDEEVLPIFDQFTKEQKKEKQVYFIHLMGSHWFYNQRYPASYNVFKSDGVADENSYLNTVYYNDMVVSELIKMAQSKGFDEVCYFSDHGEDMVNGHNPENYTQEMSVVPLLFYFSKNYLSSHQELENQLNKNKNTPAMTDNLFNIIQTTSGFSSSLYRSEDSFLSKDYVFKKRKVIDSAISFDK